MNLLKYLFTAYYNDGTTFIQPLDDKSKIEPDKRSAFFDIDHEKLIRFELKNILNPQEIYSVSLSNGEIEINNSNKIILPQENKNLSNFRLIYFRRKELLVNYTITTETGKVTNERIVCYILGWQANDSFGNNIKKTIEIYT